MDLIGLLILIIVFGILFWLVQSVLPLPPPFKTAAIVVLALFLILVLLDQIGYLGMVHRPILR